MGIPSEIEVLQSIDFQMPHLWDFIIFDDPLNVVNPSNLGRILDTASLKFKVFSTNVPMPKLDTTQSISGHNFYSKFEHPKNLELGLYEDSSFNTFNYFNDWANKVYDSNKNVFRIYPPKKNAMLVYYAYTIVNSTAFYFYENIKISEIQGWSATRDFPSAPLSFNIKLTVNKVTFNQGLFATLVNSIGAATLSKLNI
jgi:hypothetical protein